MAGSAHFPFWQVCGSTQHVFPHCVTIFPSGDCLGQFCCDCVFVQQNTSYFRFPLLSVVIFGSCVGISLIVSNVW